MMDHAIWAKMDADRAGAAHDFGSTEAPIEYVEMGHSIQHRHYGALPRHRRRDRVDGGIQIVGFAGEQDEIVVGPDLGGVDRGDRQIQVTERALDPESVARQLVAAARTDDKRDVGTGGGQPTAEVTTDSSRAEDEKSHDRHVIETAPQTTDAI